MLASSNGDISGYVESSYFVEKAQASMKNPGASIVERFGTATILKHSLKGTEGHLEMSLKDISQEFVLENIIRNPSGFHSNINLTCKTEQVKNQFVSGSVNPPKFEMSGYIGNSNLFSREHDNVVHASMQGPIQSVSEFIISKLKAFYQSDDFEFRILQLENAINEKFKRFFSKSNKRVSINRNELPTSGKISLNLMDNENCIQSINLSTGEATLYNLAFSLASAKEGGCDILCLDEPDIHMHDDMIRVLVVELLELSESQPSCITIVASHSTSLIEQMAALGGNLVHIITFDNDRNVGNSESDIELIHALQRNGVHFSPLMLSKRKNIFIENLFETGRSQKEFFLRFFSNDDLPNVIPIGSSGNVQDSKSFTSVFEQILKVAKLDSVGIQDGDIWLKPKLVSYLNGELELQEFIDVLKEHDGMYIRQDLSVPHAYYFNCWEIENLYLMDEVLPYWRPKEGDHLTKSQFKKLLEANRTILKEQYFGTFFKSITHIRIKKNYSVGDLRTFLRESVERIEKRLSDADKLEERMTLLIDSIFANDLLHWVPGKEVQKFLMGEGYTFDDDALDLKDSKVARQVREILAK